MSRQKANPIVEVRRSCRLGLFLGATAVLASGFGGCRGAESPPTRPVGGLSAIETAPEAPESNASRLEVVEIRGGDEFDFRNRQIERESSRVRDDATGMFVVVRLRHVAPPGRITGRWEYLDTGIQLAERTISLPGNEVQVEFSISRPSSGWPQGQYKFYLAVNGEDVSSMEFWAGSEEGPGDTESTSRGPGEA